jgi:D-alanyl-D-alanine carboxypeptidase
MWKGVTGVSYGSLPIDTTMLFSIGSTTKTFVAAEIFKLVETGTLSLDDTMGALLPPMSFVNPGITVRQLLGHTSGMGDFTNPSWSAGMNADLTAMWYFPTALAAFCAPAVNLPGSPYKYCNANYSLLGMIIEAKTGDSLHKVLRTDFLTPLNLHNVHMEIFEPYANPIPHNWSTPTMDPALATDESATPHEALWSSAEAAGGYFADPADLATWGYNLYSGNVLSAASLAQMTTFQPVSSSYFNGYGLGCQRFTANGRTYYGHAGNYFGYAASMLYYPIDSICVAVLINTDCIATFEGRILMNALIKKLAADVPTVTANDKFAISPNPADGSLNISIAQPAGDVQVSITDMSGREVYGKKLTTNNCTVNTSAFTPGEYVIRVGNGDAATTKHIVIQH